jgi:ABC-type sugar transport system permease subunit
MLKERSKLYLVLYLLIAPTMAGMLVFNYYPKLETILYSFYEWDGQHNLDFIGLKNFKTLLFADPLFFPTFQLVGILLVANLVKMWPSIFAAIALHRIRSEKWQYFYRVMFVLPMVIPSLVWLLVWKSFFDPNVGILNMFLNATGLMKVLAWLDVMMPKAATFLKPQVAYFIDRPFVSPWGLLVLGAIILSCTWGWRSRARAWVWWMILIPAGFGIVGVPHMLAMLAAGFVLGEVRHYPGGAAAIKWIGGICIAIACLAVLFTKVWHNSTYQFASGTPSWLSNAKLVIPSIIFWGFPWVGTFGVLIYLAGLQSISQDVYEAAELDGVGSIGKLFKIELPLMMTQVRINLIFMTIGTLTDYGLILLLLGPDGGPGQAGMVPGLYMYQQAFVGARFGYACALGMTMFVLILAITILYNKYVKVEK